MRSTMRIKKLEKNSDRAILFGDNEEFRVFASLPCSANVGDTIEYDTYGFGVGRFIKTISQDCEKARRLYNTLAGCGNDLAPYSWQWLKDHLDACEGCRTKIQLPS